jgi:hypothetical protein
MYWYIRDVVTFQSVNEDYSLIGLSLMATIVANSLFALISLLVPAYRFMEWVCTYAFGHFTIVMDCNVLILVT